MYKRQVNTLESILGEWRAASTVDDGQDEFHEAQLCVLLAAIVCLEERARLIRDMLAAAGVAITVLLTWGDTMSDYYLLTLLFKAGRGWRAEQRRAGGRRLGLHRTEGVTRTYPCTCLRV